MKRKTISINDSNYKAIKEYADSNNLSFSAAIGELSDIGIKSRLNGDIANKITSDLLENNVKLYVVGNFDLPYTVLNRAIRSSLDFNKANTPLVEFRGIVGAE